jgi:magnesium transporter
MPKYIKRISKAAGKVPGTLVHIGDKRTEKVRITVFDYNEKKFQEKQIENIEECFPLKDTHTVTWINIDGLDDLRSIEKIGEHFDLHPLLLEDVVNTGQRPKMEDFDKNAFIVLKMLYHDGNGDGVIAEQVSIILGPYYVISFQEKQGDVFNEVRERIRKDKGRIRKMGTDYLAYSLLDAIVDNYFIILEKIGDKMEAMEEDLVKNPTQETFYKIHSLKNDVVFLRKLIWPLRELISGLEKGNVRMIREEIRVYLRDVYDHIIQIVDTVETFRDMISGMLDVYLSSVSNRMNEVMKVLTIFAALFIPLTFIAGVYGMNFKFMPELSWRYGYFLVLGVMAAVAVAMLLFFKRKKWF